MLRTIVIAATMFVGANAYAEDVIIERAAPVVPRSSTTTIEKHGVDCDSKTVHRENDAGESKTVTQTDCD